MTAGRTNHTKFAAACTGRQCGSTDGFVHSVECLADLDALIDGVVREEAAFNMPKEWMNPGAFGITDAEAVQLWHDVIRSDVRPSPLLIARYAQRLTERLQERK